jgi:GTP:adenosylcobinamide-phosphate guanylyltransferase
MGEFMENNTAPPSPLVTALLVAGKRPGIDPLAAHFGEDYKVLIPIANEPMLSRVARTLVEHSQIAAVLILAQERQPLVDTPQTAWLDTHPKIRFVTGGNSVSQAVAQALLHHDNPYPALLTTADHPLLSAEIISYFIKHMLENTADLSIGVVERRVLLAQFPNNKRTWLKFRGGAYTGANLFGFTSARVVAALQLWQRIEQDRKKGRAIIAAFGPWILLGILLRLLSFCKALQFAGSKLGLSAKPVILPFAKAGIDVDKISDHALAQSILNNTPLS